MSVNEKSFRVLLDVTALHLFGLKYVWINVSLCDLKTIKDLKNHIIHRLGFSRDDISLYVREGLLLDDENVVILREDDTVKVCPEPLTGASTLNCSDELQNASFHTIKQKRSSQIGPLSVLRKREFSECNLTEVDCSPIKFRRKSDVCMQMDKCRSSNDFLEVPTDCIPNGRHKKNHSDIDLMTLLKSPPSRHHKKKKKSSHDTSVEDKSAVSNSYDLKSASKKKHKRKRSHSNNDAFLSTLDDQSLSKMPFSNNEPVSFAVENEKNDPLENSEKCNEIFDNDLVVEKHPDKFVAENKNSEDSSKFVYGEFGKINDTGKFDSDLLNTDNVPHVQTNSCKKRRRKRRRVRKDSLLQKSSDIPEMVVDDSLLTDCKTDSFHNKPMHVIYDSSGSKNEAANSCKKIKNELIESDLSNVSLVPRMFSQSIFQAGTPRNDIYTSTPSNENHLENKSIPASSIKSSVPLKVSSKMQHFPKSSSTVNEGIDSIIKEENSKYETLYCRPSVGTRLAFKVLELDDNYSPSVSEYKEGIITNIDSNTDELEIQLFEVEIKRGRMGKFENLETDEIPLDEIIKTVKHRWSALIDPRKLK